MINIMKFINVRVFIASLLIGLIAVYIYVPEMRRIYVYPTPDNINRILYKDKADNCFSLESKEIKCPSDSSKITTIPVQK